MRYNAWATVLIGLSALCWTSCSVSRQATSSHSEQVRSERVESVEKVDSVIVEQRDTLREVTTITIDRNDRGDTLKLVQITDLTRARSRDNVVAQKVKTEIVRDTVYIERRDSSLQVLGLAKRQSRATAYGLQDSGSGRASPVVSALKWILAIAFLLLASVVLVRARH